MSCNNCENLINGGICVGTFDCKEGKPTENNKKHFRHNCYSDRYLIDIICQECPQYNSCMNEHNNTLPFRISRKVEIETAKKWSGHVYAEVELNDDDTINMILSFSGACIIIKDIKAEIKRR